MKSVLIVLPFIFIFSSCVIKEFDNIPDENMIETCEGELFTRLIGNSTIQLTPDYQFFRDSLLYVNNYEGGQFIYEINSNSTYYISEAHIRFRNDGGFISSSWDDGCILKEYDKNRNLIKSKNLGSEFNSIPFFITSDNGVLIFNSDYQFIKLSENFEPVWSVNIGHSASVITTADNGMLVHYSNTPSHPEQIVMSKINSSGAMEWDTVIDGTNFYSLIQTPDYHFFILTSDCILRKFDQNGNLIFNKHLSLDFDPYPFLSYVIRNTNDNGFICFENQFKEDTKYFKLYKFSSDGEPEWDIKHYVKNKVIIQLIRNNIDGSYLLAGYNFGFSGEYAVECYKNVLIKTDNSGNICNQE